MAKESNGSGRRALVWGMIMGCLGIAPDHSSTSMWTDHTATLLCGYAHTRDASQAAY